jgi:NAD(P)-dependent dehydrogenase (short-subunit alcohol dehydrogenase family)
LLNNAGTGIAGASEEIRLSEARTVFETNFFGTIRVTNQATILALRRRSMPQGGFEMLVRRLFGLENKAKRL